MKIRVALLLLVPVLLLLGGAACRIRMSEDPVIRVRDQEHGTVLASMPVKAGDDLVFEWIHSYEHIPWIEEYTVTEDLAFRLDAIRVAGFGQESPTTRRLPLKTAWWSCGISMKRFPLSLGSTQRPRWFR